MQYAVTLIKNCTVVGHVPQEIAKLFSFFLKTGEIHAVVTGQQQIQRTGLELSSKYTFRGCKVHIKKLQKLL